MDNVKRVLLGLQRDLGAHSDGLLPARRVWSSVPDGYRSCTENVVDVVNCVETWKDQRDAFKAVNTPTSGGSRASTALHKVWWSTFTALYSACMH